MPVYRSHNHITQWISSWLSEDGRVIGRTVRSLWSVGDLEAAEWTFHYTCRGEEKVFNGATIAKVHGGRIAHLREYAPTFTIAEVPGRHRR